MSDKDVLEAEKKVLVESGRGQCWLCALHWDCQSGPKYCNGPYKQVARFYAVKDDGDIIYREVHEKWEKSV